MKRKIGTDNKRIQQVLKNKTILITGGAGSIGSHLTEKILKFSPKSVRVLDIDEYALFKLGHFIDDKRLRLLLGSILDKDRLEIAGNKVDIIIHTAAVKNIEISEFNPIETVDVNINGTINMIKTAIRDKPKIFLNVSTDKASNPSTLYGTTKLLSERLTSWAGGHIKETKFGSVRLGNVFETRGNVFEIWKEQLTKKVPLTITDPRMKRYFFHMDEAVNFILDCVSLVDKGEIFVPKMKKYNVLNLASKFSSNHKIVGLRHGEKLVENLISDSEKMNAVEKKNMWVIKPNK